MLCKRWGWGFIFIVTVDRKHEMRNEKTNEMDWLYLRTVFPKFFFFQKYFSKTKWFVTQLLVVIYCIYIKHPLTYIYIYRFYPKRLSEFNSASDFQLDFFFFLFVSDPNKIFYDPLLGPDPVFGNHILRKYMHFTRWPTEAQYVTCYL